MSMEYLGHRRSHLHDSPDYRLPPMLQVFLRYWCLMLLCSFMSTSAYYLPSLHTRVQSLQHISRSLSERHHEIPSSPVIKRNVGRRMKTFIRKMQEQRQRYSEDQYFVDRMFRIFDLNRDNKIEKGEFRAILQFLNIIQTPH